MTGMFSFEVSVKLYSIQRTNTGGETMTGMFPFEVSVKAQFNTTK